MVRRRHQRRFDARVRLTLDLRDIPGAGGTLITDGGGGNLSFQRSAIRFTARRTMQVVLAPRGGFVVTVGLNPSPTPTQTTR